MIRVTIASDSWTADSLDDMPDVAKNAMISAYARGLAPRVENLDAEPVPTPAPAYSVGWADRSKDVVDDAAKVRIEAQHAELKAAGVTGLGNGASPLGIATGTRMMREGYTTQGRRKAEHEAKKPLSDVAEEIEAMISSEKRRDVALTAGELASQISVNGKIHIAGHALTEAAMRGIAQRLESPMLGYVLGMRDRIASDPKHASAQGDKGMIAEVLRHECKRSPETKLLLRAREGVGDVYAVVSQGYVEADATTILPSILRALPRETRASFAYDSISTQWEIRASVWTPTPVEEQAIGEAFEGYVSLRSRDNGTSRFRGDGGVTLLACYNAGTYNAGGASVSRVHRGRVTHDVGAMVAAATKSISVLCKAWGSARGVEIPLTPEERRQGDAFIASLWKELLAEKPLLGVLSGRSAEHAKGLAYAYKHERRDRDEDRVVVSDLAQGWTKYIQAQEPASRREAESAIGGWLVSGAPIPGKLGERAVRA